MEDEGKKEDWDALADQLGANVAESAETAELPEKTAQTEPIEASLQLPAEPPRSGPSGWDSLAEEFGIASPEPGEVREISPDEPPAENPQLPSPTGLSEAVPQSRAPAVEQPAMKDTSPAGADAARYEDSSFGAGISSPADDLSSIAADFEQAGPALVKTDNSKSTESQHGRDQTPAQEIPAVELFESDSRPGQHVEPSDERVDAEMPQKSADLPAADDDGRTTSFWESIFGPRRETPLPETPPAETTVPEVDETTTTQVEATPSQEEQDVSDQVDEQALVDDSGDRGRENDKANRPRRRPRRRRSRSDKSTESKSESTTPKQTGSRPAKVAEESEEDPTVVPPAEAGSRSRSSKAKPPSHRNIPAWEDAMAFIVDGNLQTRTERRQTSSRSGGRGRPRSRRKKKS